MPAPPAYLDECVDHYLVGALRERGFSVTHAVDEGMARREEEAGWGQLQQRLERGYRPPGYADDDVRLALWR